MRTSPGSCSIAGWTAPLIGAGLIIAGIVIILRDRVAPHAGYWSAEALIGAEMLLLALAAGTFVVNNPQLNWNQRADGANGGLIGWFIGGGLTDAFGLEIAFGLVMAMGLIGFFLLIRYSPLVYGAAYAGRLLPVVPALLALVPGRAPGLAAQAGLVGSAVRRGARPQLRAAAGR